MPHCSSSSHGLWLSECVCVHACWEDKKNSAVNGDVTVRLWSPHESASEWPYWQLVRRGSTDCPPRWLLKATIGPQQDASLYFIPFTRGRSFHLIHTCFPSAVCLFSSVMCFAVEASHLSDIGNRSEGLLKQTQSPETSPFSLLWTMKRIWLEAFCGLGLMSNLVVFSSYDVNVIFHTAILPRTS